jgi:hypothetical protein
MAQIPGDGTIPILRHCSGIAQALLRHCSGIELPQFTEKNLPVKTLAMSLKRIRLMASWPESG